jgi:hypothetical protein
VQRAENRPHRVPVTSTEYRLGLVEAGQILVSRKHDFEASSIRLERLSMLGSTSVSISLALHPSTPDTPSHHCRSPIHSRTTSLNPILRSHADPGLCVELQNRYWILLRPKTSERLRTSSEMRRRMFPLLFLHHCTEPRLRIGCLFVSLFVCDDESLSLRKQS